VDTLERLTEGEVMGLLALRGLYVVVEMDPTLPAITARAYLGDGPCIGSATGSSLSLALNRLWAVVR